MKWIVIAAVILYFLVFRIPIGARFFADGDKEFGEIKASLFFIPVFRKKKDIGEFKRWLYYGDEQSEARQTDNEKEERGEKKGAPVGFSVRFSLALLKRVAVHDIYFAARIGTGDAASSALSVGALRVAFGQFCRLVDHGGRADIQPDYREEALFFDFDGIFSLSFADITVALCVAAVNTLRSKRGRRHANTVAG